MSFFIKNYITSVNFILKKLSATPKNISGESISFKKKIVLCGIILEEFQTFDLHLLQQRNLEEVNSETGDKLTGQVYIILESYLDLYFVVLFVE